MQFSNPTKAVVGLALLTIGLLAFAAIGSAALTDMANETVTFDESSNVTVDVTWNDSLDENNATPANVTIYGENAYQIDGDDVTGDLASEHLNGTIAEFDNVTENATYDIELNQSATTVTVASGDIADDGTVDLSNHTSNNITSDDEILSVTATADTVVTDTIDPVEANTISVTYTTEDGLVDGTEYRVIVEADDTEADDVTVISSSVGGLFTGSDGSPGFGAAVAIAAIALAAMVARVRSGTGGS